MATPDANSWNYDAEQTVAAILGTVPVVGSLLSGLTNILWPTSGNVWNTIEAQVQQLINQALSQQVQEQVSDTLAGLQLTINDYLSAVATGDNSAISDQFISTKTVFDAAVPSFMEQGYQVNLLPLFGEYGNLYLSLLRDGIMFGASWGFNTAYVQSLQNEMNTILGTGKDSMIVYANNVYQQGLNAVQIPKNQWDQPFAATNAYVRQMTLTVMDFVNLWPYYNPQNYPGAVTVELGREIYSDPKGDSQTNNFNIPTAPTAPMTQLMVWAYVFINGVQNTYPANSGPGGETQTPFLGYPGGNNNGEPSSQCGGTFNISPDNPIVTAMVSAGTAVNEFQFWFQDGSTTGLLGGYTALPGQTGNPTNWSYPNEILSSIWITGGSQYYTSADCAVFGFQYQNPQTVNGQTLERMFITNPKEMSISQLVRAIKPEILGKLDVEECFAKSKEWEKKRQEYWDSIKKTTKKTTPEKV